MCNKNIWKVEPLFTKASSSVAEHEKKDCWYAIVGPSFGTAFETTNKDLADFLAQKLNETKLYGPYPIIQLTPISKLELKQNYSNKEIFLYEGTLYKTLEDCKSITGINE